TETVRMDFWVPSPPLNNAGLSSEPFSSVPSIAATISDEEPASPVASHVAAAPEIELTAASAKTEGRSNSGPASQAADHAGAVGPESELAPPAGEHSDDPLTTTVVGFIVNAGDAAIS